MRIKFCFNNKVERRMFERDFEGLRKFVKTGKTDSSKVDMDSVIDKIDVALNS